MKKFFKKIWELTKRYKYLLLLLTTATGFWYYHCLPDKLFDSPTCTILLDREGNLLSAQIADDGQWRFPETKKVPDKFKQCLLQFEDRDFYDHPGVSLKA